MLTRKSTTWILLLLYLGAVVVSFHFSDIKYQSLNYHTRDYAFYLQFASKLLDSQATKTYSLNPDGENWLRFYGTDGANGFQKTLHFEPIKYLYAVIYSVSKSPRALFLFSSLVFFLPLLYLAFVWQSYTKEQVTLILLIAAIYVLYPASLLMPGYDLRPYIFLSAFFILTLISIALSRPLWEKLLWFNAMFLAREEALILGLVVLVYAYIKIREPSEHRKTMASLGFSFFIWTLITTVFLRWSGYSTFLIQFLAKPLNLVRNLYVYRPIILLLIITAFVLLTAAFILWWHQYHSFSRNENFSKIIEIACFSLIFLPLGYSFYKNELPQLALKSPTDILQLLLLPRYHLYFAALLGLVIVLLPYAGKGWQDKIWFALLTLVCLFFFFLDIQSTQGISKQSIQYQDEIKSARDVWALRDLTNKYQSQILVDYPAHQAFYDYQYVYAYNRLPWQMAQAESRFYPLNKPIVQELVDEKIEYVVVSKEGYNDIKSLISNGKLKVTPLFENDRFIALHIPRDE